MPLIGIKLIASRNVFLYFPILRKKNSTGKKKTAWLKKRNEGFSVL